MTDIMLSSDGYKIPICKLTSQNIKRIENDLTVCPKTSDYVDDVMKFAIYTKTNDMYVVPRYYGVKIFGNPTTIMFNPTMYQMQFSGQLREYQEDIVKKCYEHIIKFGGGLLSVPCGFGKTVMSLKIASMLGVKTLIVVDKSTLQEQWVDRINYFIKGVEIGMIRQKHADTEGKQFVVAMIQSLSKRDYGDIFKDFGFVIYDEAHHSAAKVFSRALARTATQYTMALSATPYRNDGLIHIMHWYLGDTIYEKKLQTNNQVMVKILNYCSTDKLFSVKTQWCRGKQTIACPKMITNLTQIDERDDHIVKCIDVLRKDPKRKILILSARKDQLRVLKRRVDDYLETDILSGKLLENEVNTYMYTGDLNKSDREKAQKYADIFFATYSIAQEGLDIERLNTLVFATPIKDVKQAAGRILRKVLQDGDIRPMIIDMADNLSVFVRHRIVREKFYKQSTYVIEHYYAVDDKICSASEYAENSGKYDSDDSKPDSYEKLLEVRLVCAISNSQDTQGNQTIQISQPIKKPFISMFSKKKLN
jgi:superfamily II DNA or RNA helicase